MDKKELAYIELIEKVVENFEAYEVSLINKPVKEVMEDAYKYVRYNEIKDIIESKDIEFTEKELIGLLVLENPLEQLFQWDFDTPGNEWENLCIILKENVTRFIEVTESQNFENNVVDHFELDEAYDMEM